MSQRRRRLASTAGALALAVAISLVLGCRQDSFESQVARPDGTTMGARFPQLMPARGQLVVEVSGARVTLLANQVTQLRALEELASALGFTPVGAEDVALGQRWTFEALDQPPEALVALVLRGVPYALVYDVNANGDHVLTEVVLRAAPLPAVAAGPPAAERSREEREAPEGWFSAEEREQLRVRREQLIAEREADRLARRDDTLRGLESADPRTRAESAEDLQLALPEDVERLGRIALTDPDPSVRAAAVEKLGDSKTPVSVGTLLQALDDSDRAVAVAALEALEWVGDASLIPQIQPLLSDSDPDVRVAAAEAIDWLE
jgi:HEAT repeat protein